MNLEQRKPTAKQAVFDALTAQPELTKDQLVAKLGKWAAISGLQQLRNDEVITCNKQPRYSLLPTAQRPPDKRGRKRA